MSAQVLDLSGKLQVRPASEVSTRDLLLGIVAEIDAGRPVDKVAILMLVADQPDPSCCTYETRTNADTLFESHSLFAIGARLKMNEMAGG